MTRPGVMFSLLTQHLMKKPFTVLYPKEKWALPEHYRGVIVHNNEACIGCGLCSRVCPAQAIEMVDDPEKRPLGKDRFRKQKPLFHLDRCLRCAQCEESCPKNAISLKGDVGLVSPDRKTMRVFSRPSEKIPAETNPSPDNKRE